MQGGGLLRVHDASRGHLGAPMSTRHSVWAALALTGLLLGSVLALAPMAQAPGTGPAGGVTQESLAELLASPRGSVDIPALDLPVPGSKALGPATASSIPILVTLDFSNQTSLGILLAALSDANSPLYHHFLTAAEFDHRYSPSAAAYANALDYFESFAVQDLSTFTDRISIGFDASASTLSAMLGTTIEEYDVGGLSYYAAEGTPNLPSTVAQSVAQIQGLSSYPDHLLVSNLGVHPIRDQAPGLVDTSAYPTVPGYVPPVQIGLTQYEYAPDFQVAYDEQSLFAEYGYPTNATVATILWGGNYTGAPTTTTARCGSQTITDNEAVGAFDPSDVSDFFNETLPAGEPHPLVAAVPIGGATGASCRSSWDTSGAVGENTLDLEMVGSTAPGAHIYNVYGPNATLAYLDEAFAYILSPNASFSALSGVSVITNSWGGADANDSSWYSSLEQAQARGISVLAATGDSDDSTSSSKYINTPPAQVEFPSSMAYNTFGVTAVGGTTVDLGPGSLEVLSQPVWADLFPSHGGGPYGSTGGISTVFPEPSWQRNTAANAVIAGAGRGAPDIAALANNTIVTLSVDGAEYRASNASAGGSEPFYAVAGTSVAAPLVAGLVATIDHTLLAAGDPVLGFLDPALYSVANEQDSPLPSDSQPIGVVPSSYASILPTRPFYDVDVGGNRLYPALAGYDLASGWGVLDAYNYTMYVLIAHSDGIFGRLAGVQNHVDLSSLRVSSTGSRSVYNASIQQNFFVANSLGAPVYWIQNVVYINGTPGDWSMNFTGWVVWPFLGLYPTLTTYEFNFPVTGLKETTPLDFDLVTRLVNTTILSTTPTLVYSFGVTGTPTLYLPAPGAAYILGSENDSYSWEGRTYTNGPYPGGTFPVGFLAPQFALVGGPTLGKGNFVSPTSGTVNATVEPYGTSVFYPAGTAQLDPPVSQTGETVGNLSYTPTSINSWTFGYSAGGTTQGILEFEDAAEVPGYYALQFNESGVSAGATWWVNLTGGPHLSAVGGVPDVSAYVVNGSYPWVASLGVPGGLVTPSSGTAIVNGKEVFVDLAFTVPNDTVTFVETGLPAGRSWSVSIGGEPTLAGTTASVGTTLAYGSYSYTDAGPNTAWAGVPASGSFSIGATPTTVPIAFTLVGNEVTFVPQFDGTSPVPWSVAIDGTFVNGTASNESIALPAGTYAYSISVPGPFSVTPTSGNITLSGAVDVPFFVSPSGPTSPFPWDPVDDYYLAYGLGFVALVVVIALVLRRRRPSPPPPAYPPTTNPYGPFGPPPPPPPPPPR
jgi:hypothetical protein